MKSRDIVDWYNDLVPTMNRLLKDGIYVWEFHGSSSGYGFRAIFDDYFIRVFVSYGSEEEDCEYCIYKKTKQGNILCGETIAEAYTRDYKKVYDIVKGFID